MTKSKELALFLRGTCGSRSTNAKLEEAAAHIEAQAAEIERLKDDLIFVERWAVHHAIKPHMTAKDALSCMGFDGPAIDQVEAGIEVYEAIVQASSPAQMTAAAEERSRIVRAVQ